MLHLLLIIISFEGIAFCFLVLLCIAIVFGFYTFFYVRKMIRNAIFQNVLAEYHPKTGDILLSQWENTVGMYSIPFIRYYPTHASLVWNRKKPDKNSVIVEKDDYDDIFIIEMNHFRNDSNSYTFSQNQTKGMRIIKYYDFVKDMKGILFVRKISQELDSNAIEELLYKTKHIQFEPRVSVMSILSTLAIGWRTVFPELAELSSYNIKFHEKKYDTEIKTFFCSELVIWILIELGALKKYNKIYQYSPGCLLSYTNHIDKLYLHHTWKKEEIVLKRY